MATIPDIVITPLHPNITIDIIGVALAHLCGIARVISSEGGVTLHRPVIIVDTTEPGHKTQTIIVIGIAPRIVIIAYLALLALLLAPRRSLARLALALRKVSARIIRLVRLSVLMSLTHPLRIGPVMEQP